MYLFLQRPGSRNDPVSTLSVYRMIVQYVLCRYGKFVPYYKLASDRSSIICSVLRVVGRYPLLYRIRLGKRGRKERNRKGNIFHSYIAHAISIFIEYALYLCDTPYCIVCNWYLVQSIFFAPMHSFALLIPFTPRRRTPSPAFATLPVSAAQYSVLYHHHHNPCTVLVLKSCA